MWSTPPLQHRLPILVVTTSLSPTPPSSPHPRPCRMTTPPPPTSRCRWTTPESCGTCLGPRDSASQSTLTLSLTPVQTPAPIRQTSPRFHRQTIATLTCRQRLIPPSCLRRAAKATALYPATRRTPLPITPSQRSPVRRVPRHCTPSPMQQPFWPVLLARAIPQQTPHSHSRPANLSASRSSSTFPIRTLILTWPAPHLSSISPTLPPLRPLSPPHTTPLTTTSSQRLPHTNLSNPPPPLLAPPTRHTHTTPNPRLYTVIVGYLLSSCLSSTSGTAAQSSKE